MANNNFGLGRGLASLIPQKNKTCRKMKISGEKIFIKN